MRRSLSIVSLLAIMVLLLAACGGGSSQPNPTAAASAPSAQEVLNAINIEMHDIYFGAENNNVEKPPVWNVGAGQQMNVTFDNKGALEHSWAILKQDAEMPMPYTDADADKLYYTSGHLKPSEQLPGSFTAPVETGEYIVFCTVAGHYPVMQGRLVVQ